MQPQKVPKSVRTEYLKEKVSKNLSSVQRVQVWKKLKPVKKPQFASMNKKSNLTAF